MGIALSVLIPALLLAYYLKKNWPDIKDKPILVSLLVGGILVYYAGILFTWTNPFLESTLKLLGTCLFFSGVAVNTSKRPKEKTPDQGFQQEEDSE